MLVKFEIDFGGVNFPLPYKKEEKVYVGFTAVFAGCKCAMNGNPCPDCQNPSLWSSLDWDGDIHGWLREFVRKKYKRLVAVNPSIEKWLDAFNASAIHSFTFLFTIKFSWAYFMPLMFR